MGTLVDAKWYLIKCIGLEPMVHFAQLPSLTVVLMCFSVCPERVNQTISVPSALRHLPHLIGHTMSRAHQEITLLI